MSKTPAAVMHLTREMNKAMTTAKTMDLNHELNRQNKAGDNQWHLATYFMERLCDVEEGSISWEEVKNLYEAESNR